MKIELKIETEYLEYKGFKKGELVYCNYPKGIFKILEMKKIFMDGKESHPQIFTEKRYTINGTKAKKIKREFNNGWLPFFKLSTRIQDLKAQRDNLNSSINILTTIDDENKNQS